MDSQDMDQNDNKIPKPQEKGQNFMPTKQVDFNILNELMAEIGEGSEEMISNLITTYLNHTPTLFAAIEKALLVNDLNTIYRSSHTLKSSSANLGAVQLSETAKQLEAYLKPLASSSLNSEEIDKVLLEIKPKITDLYESYAHVKVSLLDFQNKLSTIK